MLINMCLPSLKERGLSFSTTLLKSVYSRSKQIHQICVMCDFEPTKMFRILTVYKIICESINSFLNKKNS